MTIEKVVDYVLHTPLNTNKAILIAMLKELIATNGGNPDNPDNPGDSGSDIIYDGGTET